MNKKGFVFAQLAALGLVTLSACSSSPSSVGTAPSSATASSATLAHSATEGATSPATAPEQPSSLAPPASTDAVTPAVTNDQSPGAVTVTEFQQRMYEEMLVHHEIGGTFTINGTPTTLCTYGDGYGLNVITAGANTSCDFAREVSHALTGSLNPTGDNVRTLLPRTVTATSPVTDQSYTMSCSNDANNLVTCTGGNNATVYMY